MQNRENRFGFVGDNMTEQKRLGDIATYINGFAFKPENRGTAGLPIIRIQDLTGNAYDLGFYDGSYPKRIEINDGDVLISWSASLGVYIWNRGKALLNQHIFKVAFDKCEVNREYFVYAVRHKLKEMESKTHGATMKHIVKKDFDNTLIPFPTLSEQGKIAELLDTAATIISARQSQLQKLDELVKARFVEMFGDLVIGNKGGTNKKRIGEIASVTKLAGFEFTKYIQYKEHGDIIMLRGLNCKKGHLILDDIKWIDKETSDLLPRSKLHYGDILMTYAGTIGDVAMVDANDKYHLAPNVAKITVNDMNAYNPVFLMHLFMYTNDYIMTFASVVAQASINMEKIRGFEYYFPPIEKQNEFAAFVEQTDKSKAAIQKAMDEAQLLFDSLMQKYFG